MNYDKYSAKIKKIAKTLAVIKRYRILILSVLLALTAGVTVLLSVNGKVSDKNFCPPTVVYGEELRYEADAFMSGVTYEYYYAATGEWSTEMPKAPGSYKVRAVSENVFGVKKYGKAYAFVISPRELLVSAAEKKLPYGQTPTLLANALKGDTVSCASFAYTGMGSAEVQVEPVLSEVRVHDEDGKDITSYYKIRTLKTDIAFTLRAITVTVTDVTHVYDGSDFTSGEFQITEGRLADGDYLVGTFTGKVQGAGEESENAATFSVLNAKGENVTPYYDITSVSGKITTEKRPLILATPDEEKVYDGTPLATKDNYTFEEETSLAEGHYLEFTNIASITNVGNVDNQFECVICDANGTDVTENYEISFSSVGTLTVTSRPITFISANAGKPFDGTPLTIKEADVGEGTCLAATDRAEYTFTGSLTYTGEAENTFDVVIWNADNVEVTGNYTIEKEYGTLIVIDAGVLVETPSAEKEYDGEPLKAEDFDFLCSSGALPDGARFVLTDYAEITVVGSKENTASYCVIDAEGQDITENFEIKAVWGMLTVNKRKITVTAVDVDKVYDGTPLTSDEVVGSIQMPSGHVLSADVIGSQTEIGESENSLLASNVTVLFGEENVTEYFDISTVSGKLIVTARKLYVTTHSHTWTYDGNDHFDGDEWCEDCTGYGNADLTEEGEYHLLAEGHTLQVTEWTKIQTPAQSGAYNLLTFIVVDGEDTDVTKNYILSFNEKEDERGKLYVTARALTLQSASDSQMYNGEYLKAEDYSIIEGSFADGHTARVTYPTEIVDVSLVDNLFEVHIYEGNTEVTAHYDLTLLTGTLEITPRPIIVTTHSHTWTYDGNEHFDGDTYCSDCGEYTNADVLSGEYKFLDGHTLEAVAQSSLKDAGNTDNEIELIIRDASGRVVTGNYEVSYECGSLTVLSRPIYVKTHDVEWTYDGNAHSEGDAWKTHTPYTDVDLRLITVDGTEYLPLVTGETLKIAQTYTTVTNTWDRAENDLLLHVYKGDTNISANYTIAYENGTLSVAKRTIIVNTHSHTWEYDDTMHFDGEGGCLGYDNDDITTGEYALVSGHYTTFTANTGIQYVGNTKNEITLFIWDANGEPMTDNYAVEYTFGMLTVTPRRITVTADSLTEIYRGYAWSIEKNAASVTSETKLVDGHTFTVKTSGAQGTNVGEYPHTVEEGTAVIMNVAGVPVTDNYAVEYQDGLLKILPRPIQITTHDHDWLYDANPHFDECTYTNADLTEGGGYYLLVSGHTLEKVAYTKVTNVWETVEGNNEITFAVQSGAGESVTDNYDIHTVYGTLTIRPIELTVEAISDEKMYDGTVLRVEKNLFEITSVAKPLTGHTLTVETSGADRINVGEDINEAIVGSAYVVDWNGNDVTGNYEVTYVDGKAEVTPRPIYLMYTHDCKWEYDGVAHFDGDGKGNTFAYGMAELLNDGSNCYGLVGDHLLQVVARSSILNVWDSGKANIVDFEVYATDGNYMSGNYDIHMEWCTWGTLTLTKRNAHVVSGSMEKIYDGTPLMYNHIEEAIGILEARGHRVEPHCTGSQTNAYTDRDASIGQSENTFTVIIRDTSNNDITGNYNFTYEEGILTVTKRPITVRSLDDTKVYDGTPLIKEAYEVTTTAAGEALVLDHSLKIEYDGKQIFVGKSDNTFIVSDIVSASGSVAKNYAVTSVFGKLEVTPRPISLAPISKFKAYDGKPLIAHNEYEITDGSLAETDSMTVLTNYTEITLVGTKEHTFANANSATMKWTDGRDVTYCYDITYETDPGILEVVVRELTIVTASDEKTYDGRPLVNPNYSVLNLPEGFTTDVVVTGSQTLPGSTENGIGDYEIYDPNGRVMTDSGCFEVDYHFGTLTVTPEEILGVLTIKPRDLYVDYTGTLPLHDNSLVDANGGVGLWTLIRNGYSYSASVSSYRDGSIVRTRIDSFTLYNDEGKDVTYMYDIFYEEGVITYKETTVVYIYLPERTKVYDGTPLTYTAADQATVSCSDSRVSVSVNMSALSKTTVGTLTAADILPYVTVTRYGRDIKDRCTVIIQEYGLNVLPKSIEVSTESITKVYDGTPLVSTNVYLGTALVEGHTLEAKANGSITGVGYVQNGLDYCRILDEAGNDVTANYTIKINYGTLRITR